MRLRGSGRVAFQWQQRRGQAPFAGTARRVAKPPCGENQSAEAVQLGAKQIVRPISQPEFAAGFARRILRAVFPKMSAPDEQLAGAWLKSMVRKSRKAG